MPHPGGVLPPTPHLVRVPLLGCFLGCLQQIRFSGWVVSEGSARHSPRGYAVRSKAVSLWPREQTWMPAGLTLQSWLSRSELFSLWSVSSILYASVSYLRHGECVIPAL